LIQMHVHKKQLLLTLILMVAAGRQSAQASGITGEQIIATFGGVVVAGSIANDPSAGVNTYLNNATTAVYNINNNVVNNNVASSNMNWGTYSEANPNGFLPDSVLVFVGATIPSNQTNFNIGSLTFLNGTSDLPTLIFGVNMNFYAGSVSSANFLGSDTIVITTTSNVFGVPGGLTNGDDDYINICGTFSQICGTSIEAVESSEGGTGVTVNLTGTIVGDPTLNLMSVALAGGQNSGTNGFLGTDPAIGTVTPEPATWATTLGAMVLGGLLLRRRLA
jgi:hypothetical protein